MHNVRSWRAITSLLIVGGAISQKLLDWQGRIAALVAHGGCKMKHWLRLPTITLILGLLVFAAIPSTVGATPPAPQPKPGGPPILPAKPGIKPNAIAYISNTIGPGVNDVYGPFSEQIYDNMNTAISWSPQNAVLGIAYCHPDPSNCGSYQVESGGSGQYGITCGDGGNWYVEVANLDAPGEPTASYSGSITY